MNNIEIYNDQFAETEELLNNAIDDTIAILKKSPMFIGRVTLAIEISNKGNTVRPLLYKTKYVPKQTQADESQIDGQMGFTSDDE